MTNLERYEYLKDLQERSSILERCAFKGDQNSIQAKFDQARKQIYNDYLQRQINECRDKAIEEKVMSMLNNIDFNVQLNGKQISDSIAAEIVKGFSK